MLIKNHKKQGLLSSRGFIRGTVIGLAVFITVFLVLGLPTKVRRGEDGQRAIKMLDAMRRPFLMIKEAETMLLDGADAEAASASLEHGLQLADALFDRYGEIARYNPELSTRVDELKEGYRGWVSLERHIFSDVSPNKPKNVEAESDEQLLIQLNKASAGFLNTMDILGAGEVPIHKDIAEGRRAVHTIMTTSVLYFLYVIGLVFYHQNRKTRALQSSHDEFEEQVDACRRAEDALKESEAVLARAQRIAKVGSWEWDIVKDSVVFSEEAVRIYGFQEKEVEKNAYHSFTDILHPDDREHTLKKVESALSKKEPYIDDYRIVLADGTVRSIHTEAELICDDDGNPLRMIGTAQDVTELRMVEEALRDSEKSMNMAQEVGRVGTWDWNPTTGELIWSDEVYRIFGLLPDEVKPSYELFLEMVHGEDRESVKRAVEVALREKMPYKLDFRITRKNGDEGMAEAHGEAVYDKSGKPVRMLGILLDITERKKLEEETINVQKLESLGVLAGGIAHDFNNLLTGLTGNLSLLKSSMDREEKNFKRLIEVEKATLRAQELIQQLLTFSKGGKPVKETISIGDLVEESVVFALRGSNVRYELSVPGDLWPVEADSGQMNQVINNLVVNADQAMPEGGSIKVTAENMIIDAEDKLHLDKGRYVKISMEDQGIGIQEELIPKIFDPYFTTKQKGSGLGLSSIYSIINNHNGHIEVRSKVGSGTTFDIFLPASSNKVPSKADESDILVAGKGRVLVMDDEEIIRNVAGDILTSLGYDVDYAVDGNEAVDSYRKAQEAGAPFDAVIMDLTIPGGMGGKETLEKLKELDPGVKAIVSSGYSSDPIMADHEKYGFRGVIAKPYRVAELGKKMHEVIAG